MDKKTQDLITERRKAAVMMVLAGHVGEHNAIGMGELFEEVWGESWSHRINHTRGLRRVVTKLRREGTPICSTAMQNGGGYYIPAAGSELSEYLQRDTQRALRILARVARIKKITLPEYLGQMKLRMEEPVDCFGRGIS